MLEFLSEYAPVIIAVAVLAALVIILAKKGMEREAKAIVLSLVAAAEQPLIALCSASCPGASSRGCGSRGRGPCSRRSCR